MRQLVIEQQITERRSSIDRYLKEIGKFSLLSPEEEVQLALQVQQGNHKALKKLIAGNLRFVVSVAKQYQNRGLSLCDLINEGNIGLMKAAKKFDPSKGFKFISFAVWWIRQHIILALGEQCRVVRIPMNKINSVIRINRALLELQQEFSRTPTPGEIADKLEISKEEVNLALRQTKRYASLDAPFNDFETEDRNMYHIIPNDDFKTDKHIHEQNIQSEVNRILCALNEREKEILILYYGIGDCEAMTLEQIGMKFDLTRERVRQIKLKALKKIKDAPQNARLRELIE